MYVDGFVLPLPKDKIEDYKKMAELAGKVWMEHGAIAYVETLADDVAVGEVTSFPRAVQAREDETVVLSWAVYPSREVRDEVMKKVMADPRLDGQMKDMPFDGKRMFWGGFRPIVSL